MTRFSPSRLERRSARGDNNAQNAFFGDIDGCITIAPHRGGNPSHLRRRQCGQVQADTAQHGPARVLTGDNVIGGFIIAGTDQEVMCAIGPSLGAAGVGALADPTLELHEPDGTIVTNDNWRDTQEAEIIATTIPPSDDLESAIVATLDPGAYTAIVSGHNGGTGVGLVEAYDLDQTSSLNWPTSHPRLRRHRQQRHDRGLSSAAEPEGSASGSVIVRGIDRR
jgi:hypothetical protein